MTTRTDPNPGTAVSPAPAAGGQAADAGGGSDGVSGSAAELQAKLDEEKKRRSAEERAHQREVSALRAQLEDIQGRSGRNPASTPVTPAVDFSRIYADLASPNLMTQTAALEAGLKAIEAWTEHNANQEVSKQQQEAAERERLQALEDALDQGVPKAELDTTSASTIRATANAYQAAEEKRSTEERIAELERALAEAKAGTTPTAATRARQQAGATATPVSTGGAIVEPTAVETELQTVRAHIAYLTGPRIRKGPNTMAELLTYRARERELLATLAG